MSLSIKIGPAQSVKLSEIDPAKTPQVNKGEAPELLDKLNDEIGELHSLLTAAGQHSLLVVLQGMDTSGKDGTIKKVMADVNPQGCRVESFKVPSAEELAHDFLWRVHKVVPGRGTMAIFNRSHYEDVLVVRVHNLVAEEIWRSRYDQINHFEKLLTETGTVLIKFFLHISSEEQEQRLKERELDTAKAWKLSAGDWKERKYWNDYMSAYEEALSRCSPENAPWHVVPADKKWYRDVVVAETIVKALRPYRSSWEERLSGMSAERLAELKAMRESRS